MKTKTFAILLGAEAMICATAALLFAGQQSSGYLVIAQFPFAQLGLLLRALSLSGSFGNVAAFALYIGICAVPLLFVALHIKRRTFKAEDILLIVMSGFAFYMMYMMINPALFRLIPCYISEDIGRAVLGGAFYSILVGYLVFRLLRRADGAVTDSLLRILRLLLGVAAVVVVFGISYIGVADVKAKLAAILSGNTDPAVSLGLTNFFMGLRFVLTQLPAFMELVIFLMGMRLCLHLSTDRYGEEAVAAARKLASFSKKTVIVILLSCIILNLAQILFAGSLVSVDFLTTLPLDSLIVALAALLLARYFAESRALAQDNQLFI
jgi:hypothetical protein